MSSDDLPEEIKTNLPRRHAHHTNQQGDSHFTGDPTFRSLADMENYLSRIEKNYFEQILEREGGNKSKAAEQLGVKRTTLNDRLKKLGLL
jgi:DNA-binding NtrC family response regulator